MPWREGRRYRLVFLARATAMTTSRFYNTEAVVLRKSELGEADSILTLYTPKRGKLRAVARGVRRPKSKLGGHVELLTYSQMSLSKSRNLDIITQSQTIESFLPLRDDLLRTSQALYVAEIIGQSTAEEEANYPLFKLLVDTLHWLCHARNGETALRLLRNASFPMPWLPTSAIRVCVLPNLSRTQ